MRWIFGIFLICAPLLVSADQKHACALFDVQPTYPAGFKHFSYVNPDAPKGGTLAYTTLFNFNNLNPAARQGTIPTDMIHFVFESLLSTSPDDPYVAYGRIAQSVEVNSEENSVIFNLRPEAKWSDGTPLTSVDVAFTLQTLTAKHRDVNPDYYVPLIGVEHFEVLNAYKIKITIDPKINPFLMAQTVGRIPILPSHYYQGLNVYESNLNIPIGSGPYTIEKFDPSEKMVFKRNPQYWGWHLGVVRGRFNFDVIEMLAAKMILLLTECLWQIKRICAKNTPLGGGATTTLQILSVAVGTLKNIFHKPIPIHLSIQRLIYLRKYLKIPMCEELSH